MALRTSETATPKAIKNLAETNLVMAKENKKLKKEIKELESALNMIKSAPIDFTNCCRNGETLNIVVNIAIRALINKSLNNIGRNQK